ncbi:putative bifunctional diguanylate cyclase/phosphodiesterase [Sphingomonas sp. PB4P5]|uniref:putative bifunctional diguanylate cyclase/phosphodiesterase n=1 Tax=Parasphingomonas puruogangriensis TaxID=3096155 RepID=UPI002FC9AFD6
MQADPNDRQQDGAGGAGSALLRLQNAILEMIAKGESLAATGDQLCRQVEALLPDVICSILTIDAAGVLHPLAGPSLPRNYSASLDGLLIGPAAGSCGTAAYTGTDVAVTDIETDIRWDGFQHLAVPHGLVACWSSPILDARGVPVATFAFYYRERRGPTALERKIVAHCLRLCVIAIDRHHRVIEHEKRAFTDVLTGLPNRAAYNAALLTLDCTLPGRWALLVVDLDNLKIVNDSFGHQAGDRLLQVAGERVAAAILPGRVYRIGGDEFAVLLDYPMAADELEATAERIIAALALPADCGGQIVVPRATIGGAIVGVGDLLVEHVRQNADFALYHAKEIGRGGFVRYWPGLGSNITRRLSAIRDVGVALREQRIDAYYQPIFRLDTREIVGLEALCRMKIGDQVIPAASFHEATTDAQVATALTARMMAIVAADVRTWLDLGIPFQHVGINISSADLYGGTVERVLTAAFEGAGVPLKHVIVEVTETVYMGEGDHVIQDAIHTLRAKGIRVALDDFGTGFASLTHLLSVPVDILKIDKTFVDQLEPNSASMAIIEGLIGIAEKLDIRVVAEGVETDLQAEQLRKIGCTLGQGYLCSPAVDRHATTALLLRDGQGVDVRPASGLQARRSGRRG